MRRALALSPFALLVACGDTGASADGGSDVVSSDVVSTDAMGDATSNDAGVLKARCRGLMTRSGLPQRDDAGTDDFIDSVVAQVNWSDLESSQGVYAGPGWATLDQALNLGYRIRIRILSGGHAPDYVKKLGGPALSLPTHGVDCTATGGVGVFIAQDDAGTCIPYFWVQAVEARYAALMTEVAKRYENNPKVCEVVDSACMTIYAEVLYRAHADKDSNDNLYAAGLNFTADDACQRWALDMIDQTFPTTRVSLAINSWDVISDAGVHNTSFAPTQKLADDYRTKLGGKLILQNNGLGETDTCTMPNASPPPNEFCYLQHDQGPHGFQTETLARLGGVPGIYAAIDNGLGMGANFIELPGGYGAADQTKLADYDKQLRVTPP